MEFKKISERSFKFNNDHSPGYVSYNEKNKKQVSNRILSVREENNLRLRKNKLDQIIMKNRLNSLSKNKIDLMSTRKYLELEIKISDIDLVNFISEEFDQEFNSYDEKEELITQYIKNFLDYDEVYKIESYKGTSSNLNFTKFNQSFYNLNLDKHIYLIHNQNFSNLDKLFLAYAKFAIVKLRDISCLWENINDEGINLELSLFENLIKFLSTTNDQKIQVRFCYNMILLSTKFCGS